MLIVAAMLRIAVPPAIVSPLRSTERTSGLSIETIFGAHVVCMVTSCVFEPGLCGKVFRRSRFNIN